MGVIAWIVLGGIAGWIASMVMKSNQGLIADIVTGIVGAAIGGFVMSFFGGEGVTGFNVASLLVSVLGAVILLWIIRMVRRA